MNKISYRLVFNRKNTLNPRGFALIQVEALLHRRKVYFSTHIYIRPENWDCRRAQIIAHPQADDLNLMLYNMILELQGIELAYWKKGIQPTLSLLKTTFLSNRKVNLNFIEFALANVQSSHKKKSTKDNIRSTIAILKDFRPGIDFADLTYSFLQEFEHYLINVRNNKVNTVAKHLRQLRTLVNEAIRQKYMSADEYPFSSFVIHQERTKPIHLTPEELKRFESLQIQDPKLRHVLDAFLFCCYTGLRFSDFTHMKASNITTIGGQKWLGIRMRKTGLEIKLPLELLYDGKALNILSRYDISELTNLQSNSKTNEQLAQLTSMAKVKKHITFHKARHTCATLLNFQGVPITTVQKLLGHTSVKTTQIYSEILSSTIVRDLRQIKRRKPARIPVQL